MKNHHTSSLAFLAIFCLQPIHRGLAQSVTAGSDNHAANAADSVKEISHR
jgi:hypothetical protein